MEAGRQSAGVLQSFRKEIMVTWTRVEAKETVRSLLILDIVRGRIIRI